jgi:hypothetical protein
MPDRVRGNNKNQNSGQGRDTWSIPSYSKGRDREDYSSRPAQAKS